MHGLLVVCKEAAEAGRIALAGLVGHIAEGLLPVAADEARRCTVGVEVISRAVQGGIGRQMWVGFEPHAPELVIGAIAGDERLVRIVGAQRDLGA